MPKASSRYAKFTPEERKAKIERKLHAKKVRQKHGKRLCVATTNLDKPCPQGRYTFEYKGKLVRCQWCYAHIPQSKRELWGIGDFGGNDKAKESQKKFRRPTFLDSMRETIENEVAEFLAPYREAMKAEKPVPVGNGRFAHVEMVPDHRTRIQAVEAVADRAFGKPKQTQEITGSGGGPIQTEVPVDKQREEEVAKILAQHGALGTIFQAQNPISQN